MIANIGQCTSSISRSCVDSCGMIEGACNTCRWLRQFPLNGRLVLLIGFYTFSLLSYTKITACLVNKHLLHQQQSILITLVSNYNSAKSTSKQFDQKENKSTDELNLPVQRRVQNLAFIRRLPMNCAGKG